MSVSASGLGVVPWLAKVLISAVLDRVNQRLSNLEKVRRFKVLTEPFSVDNEMLTPTLKIRRHKIRRHKIRAAYGADLEALYGKK